MTGVSFMLTVISDYLVIVLLMTSQSDTSTEILSESFRFISILIRILHIFFRYFRL